MIASIRLIVLDYLNSLNSIGKQLLLPFVTLCVFAPISNSKSSNSAPLEYLRKSKTELEFYLQYCFKFRLRHYHQILFVSIIRQNWYLAIIVSTLTESLKFYLLTSLSFKLLFR
jgi:hypothetical protein